MIARGLAGAGDPGEAAQPLVIVLVGDDRDEGGDAGIDPLAVEKCDAADDDAVLDDDDLPGPADDTAIFQIIPTWREIAWRNAEVRAAS